MFNHFLNVTLHFNQSSIWLYENDMKNFFYKRWYLWKHRYILTLSKRVYNLRGECGNTWPCRFIKGGKRHFNYNHKKNITIGILSFMSERFLRYRLCGHNWLWLFVHVYWSFSSHSSMYYSYGDVATTAEGLQSLPLQGTKGFWEVRVL